jgi:hypothetical protein
MRASRYFAIVLTVLGAGLVSGSVAQVVAMDGSLEQAAKQQPDGRHRVLTGDEMRRDHEAKCRLRREQQRAAQRAS